MCRLKDVLVLGGALLVGFATRADESKPSPNGFELAFRTGVQIPLGWATEFTALSDELGVQWPLGVDLGYRLGKVFLGAYGQYSFGSGGLTSCSGCFGVRTGAVAQFHPAGRVSVDPWVGLGFGYEWQHLTSTFTLQGWDFLRIGGGCDFAVVPGFSMGPFAEISIGEFTHVESKELPFKALHYWLTIGLKLTGLL